MLAAIKRTREQADNDPYTRDTTPRTRPRPPPKDTTMETDANRRRKRMSMSSTVFTTLAHPREWKSKLPAWFNIARFVVYGLALIWTAVSLAIAVRFNTVLQASDLTTFVPFAIFVSIASTIIFPALLLFTLWKREANPISTRIELGCLGLIGTLWISLGAFMATSDAEVAEVECYATENDTEPVALPGFTTETFQAQYHVLEVFAIFAAVTIWAFFLFALVLAIRHHRRGNRDIWMSPMTALPWSGHGVKDTLPDPALARTRSTRPPVTPAKDKDVGYFDEKRGRTPAVTPGGRMPPVTPGRAPAVTPGGSTPYWTPAGGATPATPAANAQRDYTTWMPNLPSQGPPRLATQPPPPRAPKRGATVPTPGAPPMAAATSGAPVFDKFRRDTSPRRNDSQRTAVTARSGRSDKWGRDLSPRREPARNDSQRTAVTDRSTRDKWGRDASPRREPTRSESQRREPTRSQSQQRREPTRSQSQQRREPARTDSQRRPGELARTESQQRREPARTDSQRREPARTDSQRRDPTRSDSQRRDPTRSDSQRKETPRR